MEGTISDSDKDTLMHFFDTASDEEIHSIIADFLHHGEVPKNLSHLQERVDTAFRDIQHRTALADTKVAKTNWRIWAYAVAALALVALSAIIYLHLFKVQDESLRLTSQYGDDVLPGGNRATLALSGGQSIALSEDKGGIAIDGNEITYMDGTDILKTEEVQFATLTTPNSGQYQITLPDGSKVWLNAASSLSYPTHFMGDERKVELVGEAYFEVADNEKQPFIVESKMQSVQVLGTAFNINAYDNEKSVTTTLVNGSVQVKRQQDDKGEILKPNHQSILDGQSLIVQAVDIVEYTAWKNGQFHFNATDLKTVLRQLERWYDITIDYTQVPDRKLHAVVDRDKKLSTVLYTIEKTSGITFKLEERRLTIQE